MHPTLSHKSPPHTPFVGVQSPYPPLGMPPPQRRSLAGPSYPPAQSPAPAAGAPAQGAGRPGACSAHVYACVCMCACVNRFARMRVYVVAQTRHMCACAHVLICIDNCPEKTRTAQKHTHGHLQCTCTHAWKGSCRQAECVVPLIAKQCARCV